MNNILVSIIIPVYNAGEFLEETLDSILSQSYKNIEVICVDDGSTDNSLRILEEYSDSDNRVKIIKQKNMYAGVARNNGIIESKGDYLYFMDSDDFIEKDLILHAVEKALENNSDIVLFDGNAFNNLTKKNDVRHYLHTNQLNGFYNINIHNSPNLLIATNPATWTKLFKRELITNNNLFFSSTINSNDFYFTKMALLLAENISVVDEKLYNYRINLTQNLQSNIEKTEFSVIKVAEELFKELFKLGMNSETYMTAAANATLAALAYTLNNTISINKLVEVTTKINNSPVKDYILEYAKPMDKEDFDFIARKKIILEAHIEGLLWKEKFDASNLPNDETIKILAFSEVASPKISTIITIYNMEKYLEETIKSIQLQTYNNIELIIINDGSTDNSLEKIIDLCKNHNNITIIDQINMGLSKARNIGLEYAKGEYIYYIDGDDILEKDTFEQLILKADEQNLDILYFDGKSFYENEELEKEKKALSNYYCRKNEYSSIFKGPDLYVSMKKNGEYRTSAVMCLYKKEFLQKNNLKFTHGIYHEDNEWMMKCIFLAERTSHMQKQFYKRRVRNNSIVTMKTNFMHMYGLFLCGMNLIDFITTIPITITQQNAAYAEINTIFKVAREKYANSKEKHYSMDTKLKFTSKKNTVLFRKIIYDYTDITNDKVSLTTQLNSYKNKNSEMEKRLKKKTEKIEKLELKNKDLKKKVKQLNNELKQNKPLYKKIKSKIRRLIKK